MDALFTRATTVERVGPDRFTAEVSPAFAVPGGAPNGGYLTALAANALRQRLDAPDPLTVTTHYLAPPATEPIELVTEVLKEGGRHRTGAVRVLQRGREVLRVTGTFTDLERAEGPTHVDATATPPHLDDASLIAAFESDQLPPVFAQTSLRLTPASVAWAWGEPSGVALLEGRTGIPDLDPVPTLGLLFLADAVPPPIFSVGIPFGWMPTLELTTQVRARPAPGELTCRFQTRWITRGYLELDGELWDADGQLVALARQTALAPRPA